MTAPVRLIPEHGFLLERAVMLVVADYRRAGVREVAGAVELLEIARQLKTDGVRLVLSPHETTGDASSGQTVTGSGVGAHGAGVPQLLDRTQVARHLGVSVRTVDRRVTDGTLPCRRLGRRVLFDPAAITNQEHQCTAS